ncbi:MAG TPA: peptidylprolyl isomerase [Verrucomicrobiae bacterium]
MQYPVHTREYRTFAPFVGLLFFVSSAVAQNGIFADFTSSLGNFTCQLDYTNAPKAVANFIGLATGQRGWLDLPTGTVRNIAFYDGLLFHRVISGFMIQSGSPNGQGSDGPGYAFPDEFTPSLRFSGPGVLAMANSGPKSNGSQFFITVAATTWLNDVHTIFGWLVSGTNVVIAISQVATNTDSKPLTNVVIQKVSIRRVGAAAAAFDVGAQNLPVVGNPGLKLTNAPGFVSLSFTNRQFADNRLYSSTNLATWSPEFLGIEVTFGGTNTLYRTKNANQGFYRFAQIQYPSSTFAPRSLYSRTVVLTFDGGAGVITLVFDANGGGTYTYPPGPTGTVTSYDWSQEPYRGYLWPIYYSDLVPMTLELDFNSNTAGKFSGTAYTSPFSSSVSGTFTLSP